MPSMPMPIPKEEIENFKKTLHDMQELIEDPSNKEDLTEEDLDYLNHVKESIIRLRSSIDRFDSLSEKEFLQFSTDFIEFMNFLDEVMDMDGDDEDFDDEDFDDEDDFDDEEDAEFEVIDEDEEEEKPKTKESDKTPKNPSKKK